MVKEFRSSLNNKKITMILVLTAAFIFGFFMVRWFERIALPKVEDIVVEVVAENLVVPWSIDFLPEGKIIFTERVGRINVIDENVVAVAEIDVATVGEGGLLGIAVDPEFEKNNFVYIYHTYSDDGNLFNKIVRFKMIGFELVDETVVLDKIPGARFHNGGRIKFGADGKLYITTGDALEPMLAQEINSLAGKILRINKDGSIPEDNPLGNEIYSYGHRNPQGLAWHPVTGELYSTEHGALRNDEINIIKPGKNYGWPVVECYGEGYENPIRCYEDFTLAPGGTSFYNNDLYIAGLRGEQLRKIVFDKDYETILEEEAINDRGRIRDVVERDGYLYITTSNKDGRGTPRVGDDKIIKIKFIKEKDEPSRILGETVYVESAKSNIISVIDVSTNRVIRNIAVGNAPHDLKLSPDQRLLYTTDIDSGTISIINTTTNTLSEQIKTGVKVHGIAILNDTLYVGDVYGGRVLVIENKTVVDTIKVGSGPEYLEIRPDGKVMYVANLWSPISVVDLKQKKVIKEIDSGKTPHGLSFSKDGSKLYIVNMKTNTLSIIDAINHEIIKTIPVGSNPEYVTLSPDERFAYVTNLGDDTVSVVDTTNFEIIDTIEVGDGPHGIAFTADGKFAYVSNMNSNDVSVIDTEKGKAIATIMIGREPHQIVLKKPVVRLGGRVVYVEIADEPEEWQRGLMFREALGKNYGMLFVFGDEQIRRFWMKNTLIPLDIIFIDSTSRIVDIKENFQPCIVDPCPAYTSKTPAKYVLELKGGFVLESNIDMGAVVEMKQ